MSLVRVSTVVTALFSFLLFGAGIAGLVFFEVRVKGSILVACPYCNSFAYIPGVTIMVVFIVAGLLGMGAAFLPQRGALNAIAAVAVTVCFIGVTYFHVVTLMQAFTSESNGSLQSMFEAASMASKCQFNQDYACRGYGTTCLVADITNQFNANCPQCSAINASAQFLPLAVPRCGSVIAFAWQSRIIPVTALASAVNVTLLLLCYAFALRAAYQRSSAAPTINKPLPPLEEQPPPPPPPAMPPYTQPPQQPLWQVPMSNQRPSQPSSRRNTQHGTAPFSEEPVSDIVDSDLPDVQDFGDDVPDEVSDFFGDSGALTTDSNFADVPN